MSAQQLAERLRTLRARVDAAAQAHGRRAGDVTILLATKTVPPARIIPALQAGYTVIGENRVQEVVAKAAELAPFRPVTHFIGHLQSNKVNQVLPHIGCLQTIDRPELARRVDTRLAADGERRLPVMIQVNVSGEQSKFGIDPSLVPELAQEVAGLDRLELTGFMTIGLNSTDLGAVAAGYERLAALRDHVVASGTAGTGAARELSMGMSGDFETAIAAGATIVRLGSAVFGGRLPAAG